MDRSIEMILAEWRLAEMRLDDEPWNVDLQQLVDELRNEHAAALEARKPEADALREYGLSV